MKEEMGLSYSKSQRSWTYLVVYSCSAAAAQKVGARG